jgi:hypothetical protein
LRDSFHRRHGLIGTALLIANLIVAVLLRGRSDLVAIVQALLLFDTLIIVWIYTVAAQQQAQASTSLFELSRKENNRARVARWQESKPIVFTDRRDEPQLGEGNYQIVMRNVGGGFAVNVYCLLGTDPKVPSLWALGALAPGAERVLHKDVPFDEPHVVIAEGVHTRTRRWNPTLNAAGAAGGYVHRLWLHDGEANNGAVLQDDLAEKIEDYANRNWPALLRDLNAFVHDAL